MRKIDGLSPRDQLYNEILKTVKDYGAKMQIGLITAVLAEVQGDIMLKSNNLMLESIYDELKERTPRKPV